MGTFHVQGVAEILGTISQVPTADGYHESAHRIIKWVWYGHPPRVCMGGQVYEQRRIETNHTISSTLNACPGMVTFQLDR